jgi:hypothetical protein
VNTSLTTVTVLVTLIHVVALGVMIWIRVRRSDMARYRPVCAAH